MPDKQSVKRFGRVAVLMGGWSQEREISLKSGRTVLESLKSSGVDAFAADIAAGADIFALDCDRAFIALHGKGGEDGVVQSVLEAMHVPYTGSAVLGSALAMDKAMSKRLWMQAGLPTANFVELAPGFDPEDVVEQLGLPLAVKPALEGSSLGVSRVDNADRLFEAWQQASAYGVAVIAERWIAGEEYAVGFLRDRILPPIKLEFNGHDFYNYEAKYEDDNTHYICPCGLSVADTAHIQSLSYLAASALQVDGWGRADLRRDAEGRFWLLEINTSPGMTEHSLVPKSARVEGMDFDQVVLKVLETAVENGAGDA